MLNSDNSNISASEESSITLCCSITNYQNHSSWKQFFIVTSHDSVGRKFGRGVMKIASLCFMISRPSATRLKWQADTIGDRLGISISVSTWLAWASSQRDGLGVVELLPRWLRAQSKEAKPDSPLRSWAQAWHCITSAILCGSKQKQASPESRGVQMRPLIIRGVSKNLPSVLLCCRTKSYPLIPCFGEEQVSLKQLLFVLIGVTWKAFALTLQGEEI